MIWKRVVDWCVPSSALQDIGRVRWRIEDGPQRRAAVQTIAASFQISTQLLNSWDTWMGPRNIWKRWPSLDEIIFNDLQAQYKVFAAKLEDQLRDTSLPDQVCVCLSACERVQSDADHQVGK